MNYDRRNCGKQAPIVKSRDEIDFRISSSFYLLPLLAIPFFFRLLLFAFCFLFFVFFFFWKTGVTVGSWNCLRIYVYFIPCEKVDHKLWIFFILLNDSFYFLLKLKSILYGRHLWYDDDNNQIFTLFTK